MFPIELKESVFGVLSILPDKSFADNTFVSSDFVFYVLNDEIMEIPYRIYFLEPDEDAIEKLDETQKLMLYCIYTRSCNGYIRQKYIEKILSCDFPKWCIPYIVKLSDEYVVEILDVIYEKLKNRNNDDLKEFCRDNWNNSCKSYQRMISYWDVFYRVYDDYYNKDVYKLKDYVGRKLFIKCFGISPRMKIKK